MEGWTAPNRKFHGPRPVQLLLLGVVVAIGRRNVACGWRMLCRVVGSSNGRGRRHGVGAEGTLHLHLDKLPNWALFYRPIAIAPPFWAFSAISAAVWRTGRRTARTRQ